MVNARPGDHVDVVIVLKKVLAGTSEDILTIRDYKDIDIESVLFDDGPPYTTYQMEFTVNHDGSVATAGYMDVNNSQESSMELSRFVLYCESLHAKGISNGKDIEHWVKTTEFMSKEEEDEKVCVICHKEYQPGELIGTLECKHSYHRKCIIKWLSHQKNSCPMCRTKISPITG